MNYPAFFKALFFTLIICSGVFLAIFAVVSLADKYQKNQQIKKEVRCKTIDEELYICYKNQSN